MFTGLCPNPGHDPPSPASQIRTSGSCVLLPGFTQLRPHRAEGGGTGPRAPPWRTGLAPPTRSRAPEPEQAARTRTHVSGPDSLSVKRRRSSSPDAKSRHLRTDESTNDRRCLTVSAPTPVPADVEPLRCTARPSRRGVSLSQLQVLVGQHEGPTGAGCFSSLDVLGSLVSKRLDQPRPSPRYFARNSGIELQFLKIVYFLTSRRQNDRSLRSERIWME